MVFRIIIELQVYVLAVSCMQTFTNLDLLGSSTAAVLSDGDNTLTSTAAVLLFVDLVPNY